MNVAHQALVQGHTVLFVTASLMIGELAALDSNSTLRRRLRRYAQPDILVIDEVGYLSYSNRHADLLFELISRRYQNHTTIVTTGSNAKARRPRVPELAHEPASPRVRS